MFRVYCGLEGADASSSGVGAVRGKLVGGLGIGSRGTGKGVMGCVARTAGRQNFLFILARVFEEVAGIIEHVMCAKFYMVAVKPTLSDMP